MTTIIKTGKSRAERKAENRIKAAALGQRLQACAEERERYRQQHPVSCGLIRVESYVPPGRLR